MKSPDNVLLGIAFILLAGVILYNVFTKIKKFIKEKMKYAN